MKTSVRWFLSEAPAGLEVDSFELDQKKKKKKALG